MIRRRVLALLLAGLAGCTTVSQPAQDSRERLLTDYLQARDLAIVQVFRIRGACEDKKLSAQACKAFEADLVVLKQKDEAIRAVLIALLKSPDLQIDQDSLTKLLEFAGSAAKIAAIGGMLL